MKKVFKWLWYNKEQLGSIIYSAITLGLSNIAMWTDTFSEYINAAAELPVFANIGGAMAVKVAAIVLAVGGTALSIRNTCVTYGVSSLETIDKVLAERAAKKKNKLTAEQKKMYKEMIATLKDEAAKVVEATAEATAELEKITSIHNADASLVPDYVVRKQQLERRIASNKATAANIENKMADYKAILKGTKSAT